MIKYDYEQYKIYQQSNGEFHSILNEYIEFFYLIGTVKSEYF